MYWKDSSRLKSSYILNIPTRCSGIANHRFSQSYLLGTFRVYFQYQQNIFRVESISKHMSTCSNPFEYVTIINTIYSHYQQIILTEGITHNACWDSSQ